MPPPRDIAWKFVIELEGKEKNQKKWRCPYCKKVCFGQVTRVRSHLLKISGKGICPCQDVPEHLSELMGWLQNQVRNKDEIAWKFVKRLEDNRWRCYHCSEEFSGDLTGVKGHLLEVPNGGISICTEVPDHVRKLMRSLLDEAAEEESREADGQSSMEPQSRDLPTQADVAEEESREANRQLSTMPSSVQNSRGSNILEQPASVSPQHQSVPHQFTYHRNVQPNPTMLLGNPDTTRQPDPSNHRLDAREPPVLLDQPTHLEEGSEQQNLRRLSPFPNDQFLGNSISYWLQELNGDGITSDSPIFSPGLLNLHHPHSQSLMDIDPPIASQRSSDSHNFEATSTDSEVPGAAMDTIGPSSSQDIQRGFSNQEHPDRHATLCTTAQERIPANVGAFLISTSHPPNVEGATHLKTGSERQNSSELLSLPNEQYPNPVPQLADGITSDPPATPGYFNFHSLPESRDANVNTSEEIQMNELHDPTMGSSLQNDSSVDVDGTNCLPYCSQAGVAEVVHTTDSHIIVDSQVPEASTNTIGPSSSQDMNRVSPIMNVRSIYSNDEEIRNLKRKVEELEAVMEQMGIEPAASSVLKKPRIVVQKCLKESKGARNNLQMIGQANAEILPPTEQVETSMREREELIEQTLPDRPLIEARDAKGNAFLERKLIGEEIHRNIELIWNRLKENHGCKLGICGMGGVGKTTIMMHVHNRLLNDPTFDGVLFITVSQDFSIYKLQSDVWKALKFGVMEDEHEKKLAAMLSEHLERKKNCVLILDDVWRHFKLQDVGIPDKPGLKVVLTTRLSEVCSRMDCEEIKIQPLGKKEAWKLFEEELGPQTPKNIQIEKVARKITNRCAGLPLAINAMARSMRGEKNVFVWQDTLNKLERSHTEHTEMGDEVLPVLKLSYERLSGRQVKQCFVFCALFAKDELIGRKELIEYFIDEGFLDELDTREEQYCRGLAIVDKLQNACLLELDFFDFVRMHDLMRDMALGIMNMTCMVKAGQGLRTIPNGERWTEDLEKVSLMRGRIEDIPPDMSPNCPKLSTLLLNGSLQLENEQLQHSFFMKLQGLKVLNLSKCAITKLPDSLSELANLRALLLRYCESLIRIPYLGKLEHLRKLDAKGCKSLLAVEGLEELINLRYLDLSKTSIERSWEGAFSRIVNLQFLKIAGEVKAKEVIRLKALKRLECNFGNVDNFNEYVRFMERRGEHHNYKIIVDQDNSLWFVSESVYFDREILPENEIEYEWVHVYNYCIRFVEIRSCNYDIGRVGEERIDDCIWIPGDVEFFEWKIWRGMTNLSGMRRLRCLKVLIIVKWDNLVELFGGAGVDAEEIDNAQDTAAPLFPSLVTLEIVMCSKLKYLFGHESRFSLPPLLCEGIEGMNSSVASPPQPEESGNMKRGVGSEWLPHFPSLKRIMVEYCDNIRELFPHECLLHLPNLEEMIISCCEKLEEIIGGGPMPSGVTFGRLTSLYVSGCNNMKRVLLTQDMLLHLPSLEKIRVENCEGIEVIIGGGPVPIGATCGRLRYLEVNGCNNMKRVLLTQDILLHLPSLQKISVQNCEGIEVIIGAVANTTHASFPKLALLILKNLPELKSICDDGWTGSCDSLEYVDICQCPKLKRIPILTNDDGEGSYILVPPIFNIFG